MAPGKNHRTAATWALAALLFLFFCGCDATDTGPYVRITSPAGGERWAVGEDKIIRWSSSGVAEVVVLLSRDAGESWEPIDWLIDASDGACSWIVDAGGDPLQQRHSILRVSSMDDGSLSDESDELTIWSGVVWHVDDDASSGGDGTSWATAFQRPQDAVNAASAGDDVWVAAGTYTDTGGPWSVVTMKDGVAVYGGFLGAETDIWERDATMNETVFDGRDLPGNVVVAASDAVLDGFTLTRGHTSDHGGGVYAEDVNDFLLANCIVMDNYAQGWGGGGCFRDSEVCIDSVIFEGNEGGGGGLSCKATVVILDCQFIGNKSSSAGGGIDVSDCDVVVSGCIFTANEAATFGGGVACSTFPGQGARVDNCVFLGNTAARGAGTACWANASLEVSSSTFSSNRATEMGVVDGFGDVTISMSDCIVWGNTSVGAHVSAYENAVATVAYSLVEGGWVGEGNISANPMFKYPGNWDDSGTPGDTSDDFFVTGDYRLSSISPCIDAGDPTSTVTEDIEGNLRNDGRVDVGAYEFVDDGPSGLAAGAGCAGGVKGPSVLVSGVLLAGLVCWATRRRHERVDRSPGREEVSDCRGRTVEHRRTTTNGPLRERTVMRP